MGAGKSSVGRRVATKLGWPRYDTDEMVKRKFGMPIAQLFAKKGEAFFRDAEAEALREIDASEPGVIVTGGGILLRKENAQRLRRLGHLIYLQADEETLFRRVSKRATRPLLQAKNPRQRLHELLQVRAPLYEKFADATIETTDLDHDGVAKKVLRFGR